MSKFSCSKVFFHYRYLIKVTTTDLDMFLQVQLQFWNSNGFVATSDVIICFSPISKQRS